MEPTERLVSVLFHLIYVAYANTKYVMDCVFSELCMGLLHAISVQGTG